MATETASAVLGQDIEKQLADFAKKRERDKAKAFCLKVGAAALGAAVTVLLGLKLSADWEARFKNVALVAGALVAILNAWEAFYDHKGLWVKRTTTVARLSRLARAFRLARATQTDVAADDIQRFQATLDQILDDDLSTWVQMRNDGADKKPAAGGKGGGV